MFLEFATECKKIPVSSFKLCYTVGLRAHTVLFYYTPDQNLANAQAGVAKCNLDTCTHELGSYKGLCYTSPKKQIGRGNVLFVRNARLVFFSFDFHFGDWPHLNGYFFNFQVGSFDSV